ncbi:MAG: hypothetical protein LBI99_00755 [Propionibacteriaceae bacterium]|nr:hypothetical protein [Propionibacteriaceae bacterium]
MAIRLPARFSLIVGAALSALASLGLLSAGGCQSFAASDSQSDAKGGAGQSATLRVEITGLPADAEGVFVVVNSVGGVKMQRFTGSGLFELEGLADGGYQVEFAQATAGDDHFYALGAQPVGIAVAAGAENLVEAAYTPLVLTFAGLGKVLLGMTLDQARDVDPSVRELGGEGECAIAENENAKVLAFGSDGKLAYIEPKQYVATQRGIRAGSTGMEVANAYQLRFETYQLAGFPGVYVDAAGDEADFTAWRPPYIGIEFGESGQAGNEWEGDIADAAVLRLVLDDGQECFD